MSQAFPVRPAVLALASLHLRVGLGDLAHVRLEEAAERGELDLEALADLAEARFRAGDLVGAGEAARGYLEAGGQGIVPAFVIAESLAYAGDAERARAVRGWVLGALGPDARARVATFAGNRAVDPGWWIDPPLPAPPAIPTDPGWVEAPDAILPADDPEEEA